MFGFPCSKTKDALHLLSLLTFRRFAGALMALVTYYLSRILQRPFLPPLPVSISIEPTTSCNLRCPECVSGLRSFTRPTGIMDLQLFNKIIEELHPNLLYLILYFQGEPYLVPELFYMIKFASEKKIYTATSTNGHFLTMDNALKTVDSGLSRMIISVDGTTQETFQKYRVGGNLNKVIEGIKNVIEAKRLHKSTTPFVIIQFVVFSHNEHEVKDIFRLGKELGVNDIWIKTAQVYDYENGNSLIPSDEKKSRYRRKKDGTYSVKHTSPPYGGTKGGPRHCWKMWHSCVITWDGRIVPCCFDKDAQHQLGTIGEKTFAEIWRSPQYNQFRKRILDERWEIDICKNCSEGTNVWI